MEVLQNRLNSFVKQKRGKSLKWPHPKTWKTNPDTLAEAGFYFDPSAEDPDNATCFMCNKQVTEWAEEDDPFDIHWEKCANVCAWANVRCGLRRDADAHGRFVFPDKSRLPTSKAMEKARLETFTAHGWKHDKNKKHLASSKKMAHAGFVFTPAEAGDDTGTCLYCQVALGNWDEDDDPMQHHRDRDNPSDPCPFLALAFGAALPPSKSQAKQPKTTAKRVTKAKPLTHTDVVLPTKTYDGSDDEVPAPFPKATTKTPRKTTSTSTAKTPRTLTRSSSRVNSRDKDVLLHDEHDDSPPPPKKRGRSRSVSRPKVSEDDQVDDRDPSPVPPTRQRRPTTAARSRSKSVARPASAIDATNLFDDDDDAPQPEPVVTRKASRSKSKVPEDTDGGDKGEEPVARKPSRSKSKAREVEADVDGEEAVQRKTSRSKAKAKVVEVEKEETKRPPSRSQPKPQPPADGASSDDGWFVAPLPPPPAARSRTKSVSKPKGKTQETDVDEPAVVSRKERKKKQAEEPEEERPPSKTKPNALEAVVDPVVRKPSRSKSKASVVQETEVKKPPSRAKAKPPPTDEEPEADEEMEMDQYLPPSSPPRPPAEKARSKPPSKVAEEPKAPRGRKPSSRSTSKPVLPKFEPPVPAAEVEEEEEPQPIKPEAPPPPRTRKAFTRATSTAPPVSRPASATAKAGLKTKRDPSPDLLESDIRPPQHSEPVALPRQGPSSRPASRAAGPSSLQAIDFSTTSRKPESKGPSLSRSTSQASLNASRSSRKDVQRYDDHDEGSGEESGDGLPVVDISTDDEEPRATKTPLTKTPLKAKGKEKTKVKEKQPAVEVKEKRISFPVPTASQPVESNVMDDGDDDVEMAEVEESMNLEPDPLPVTPPRAHAPTPSNSTVADEPAHFSHGQTSPEGFPFIPPLATDPFVDMDSLSEAEQEMTVEEWIRYQMGIEYERFKRDGERQLGMFERRAEEVRRAIESL